DLGVMPDELGVFAPEAARFKKARIVCPLKEEGDVGAEGLPGWRDALARSLRGEVKFRELTTKGDDLALAEPRRKEIIEGDLFVEDDPDAGLSIEENFPVGPKNHRRQKLRKARIAELADQLLDALMILLKVHERAVGAHLGHAIVAVLKAQAEDAIGRDQRAHLDDGFDRAMRIEGEMRALHEIEDRLAHSVISITPHEEGRHAA